MIKDDPGACPICGAAHTACTGGTKTITVAQLPARDALLASEQTSPMQDVFGDGSDDRPFSTGTYRGKKKR